MPRRSAILLGFLLLAPASASVQTKQADNSFEAQHAQALAGNPPGVHLKISLESGNSTFHQGETVRVKYEFTADAPGKYVAGARFLDRGGRSVLESFFADRPASARDPLKDFWEFRNALGGSNLFAPRDPTLKLGSTPQFDSIELTHYLRFARPGRYRVYAVTRSVVAPGTPIKEQGGPAIASENTLTLQILPQDLSAASREVDGVVARAHQQPIPRYTPVEAFRLFEISTPKARKAAASLYTHRNNYPASDDISMATILAAPTRAESIAVLNARLRDVTLVADDDLLINLAMLQFMQKHPWLAPSAIRAAEPQALAAWRSEIAALVAANWEVAAATLERRPPDIRASTAHWLDHINSFSFYNQMLPIPPADGDRIRALHLSTLPDEPPYELSNDLLNFRWTKSLPSDSVLAILMQIYAAPPAQNAMFIRETALKEIAKLDPEKAQSLFRDRMLDMDTPLDWNRIHSLNLPPGADLDAALIKILEDRWTERMSRVAPIIGLYATAAVLPRVKTVYEIYGPDWSCSIQSGLLTYFLRVDPAYGTEKLGPALSAYYARGGSDCHRGNLLLDTATLRNPPELQPFISAALNDPRPLVAAAGAQVTAFGDQAKIPLAPLLARLRALHDEWPDFASRSASDPEYLQKWNSGYNQLESALLIDFLNAEDSPEKPAIWRQALDLCITDQCRDKLRERLARSKF